MFSTIASPPRNAGRAPATIRSSVRPQCRTTDFQTLEEAYEMRLLAQVARCEDQAAFEEIYAHHHAAVMRVAQHVCRDHGAAEDIAQQTFTALWVRAARLVEKSVRLRPWLTTVARNAAIDRLRAETPCASVAEFAPVASTVMSAEDAAIAGDATAVVASALTMLSPEQRAAIELVYLAGMTYQSAADRLGEPIGTVKSRVRLAIGHLRIRMRNLAD